MIFDYIQVYVRVYKYLIKYSTNFSQAQLHNPPQLSFYLRTFSRVFLKDTEIRA